MTSMVNEVSSIHKDFFAHLPCSTSACLRNQTRVETKDFLEWNSYAKDPHYHNHLTPLEQPFPFFSQVDLNRNHSISQLRMKFFHQSQHLLPDPLPILLTISSSTHHPLVHDQQETYHRNALIEQLLHYAYTRWDSQTKKYHFDRSLLHYHQQILAPLLKYAQHLPHHRHVHLIERIDNRFHSELPLTFGYVLAPSMSVFNQTYLNATEEDRRESMQMMDLFANLIHQG